ncbi:MAG: hypothetical protein RR478_05480 [Bacilli bacterium]
MNIENLKPISTTSEARELGRMGGIASGIARRERIALKDELILLLSTKDFLTGESLQKKMSIALIDEATRGNVLAYKTIRDMIEGMSVKKSEFGTNKQAINPDDEN